MWESSYYNIVFIIIINVIIIIIIIIIIIFFFFFFFMYLLNSFFFFKTKSLQYLFTMCGTYNTYTNTTILYHSTYNTMHTYNVRYATDNIML